MLGMDILHKSYIDPSFLGGDLKEFYWKPYDKPRSAKNSGMRLKSAQPLPTVGNPVFFRASMFYCGVLFVTTSPTPIYVSYSKRSPFCDFIYDLLART